MSANQNIQARNEASAFAKMHLKALASELIQWQDTGVVQGKKIRELAGIWAKVDEQNALKLAENTITRAAINFIVHC